MIYNFPATLQGEASIAAITEPKHVLFDGTQYVVKTGADLQEDMPLVTVPEIVTMKQARLALLHYGLLSAVTALIAELPSTLDNDAIRISWEYSTEVARSSPTLQALVPSLGFTQQQLDELFILAATL